MKLWKRNAIIATVLLFVCAGIYLNWSYTRDSSVEDLTATLSAQQLDDDVLTISDSTDDPLLEASQEGLTAVGQDATEYFSEVRLSRQEARDSAVTMLQEAMAYESGGDTEAVTTSAAALEDLVDVALQESQIESMVIAKGYADCVAYMTDDGISLAVSAPAEGLDQASVAQLADIVTTQTDYSLADLRIIEVK
jgi:stage III sporulation protein AH